MLDRASRRNPNQDSQRSTSGCILTIICGNGLRYLRPERSWRPIVTVSTKDTVNPHHEIILGSDGQNPNMKHSCILHDVGDTTPLNLNIWHKSQSKKKRDKRLLVGAALFTLGDLFRREGHASGGKYDIRINRCFSSSGSKKSRSMSDGNLSLTIKIQPLSESRSCSSSSRSHSPSSSLPQSCIDDIEAAEELNYYDSSSSSSLPVGDQALDNWSEVVSLPMSGVQEISKPRQRKGYCIWSDEEELHDGRSISSYVSETEKQPEQGGDVHVEEFSGNVGFSLKIIDRSPGKPIWIAASMLPVYTDQMSITSTVVAAEWMLDHVAPYRHFKEACVDSDWEAILSRMQTEWYYIGGSLVSLAALFAAVFGFGSGTLFAVDGMARRSVAIGSVASGIGISVDAWFIFSYSGADAGKFKRKAADVFGTYFFFCISARIPALCMLTSAIALMVFLLVVAWSTWSSAVLVMCFLAGALLGLQFILFAIHRLLKWTFLVARSIYRSISHLLAYGADSGGTAASAKEQNDSTSESPGNVPICSQTSTSRKP